VILNSNVFGLLQTNFLFLISTTYKIFSPYYGTDPPADTLLVTKLGGKDK